MGAVSWVFLPMYVPWSKQFVDHVFKIAVQSIAKGVEMGEKEGEIFEVSKSNANSRFHTSRSEGG